VTVAANVASVGVNAQVKAAANVASGLSAARATPPMPTQLSQLWAQTRRPTATPQPKAPAQPKTVSAANADRVTDTAVTAANALAKRVRTRQANKPLATTQPSPAARAQKLRLMTALPHVLISSVPSKLQPHRQPRLKPARKLPLLLPSHKWPAWLKLRQRLWQRP
jgi:monoamine oxidase